MMDYSNKTVKIRESATHPQFSIGGELVEIEGSWRTLTGTSWMVGTGNPACMLYAMRLEKNNLPWDDDVFYGKIYGLGVLIHSSEIESVV